jgi:hypothetical protein
MDRQEAQGNQGISQEVSNQAKLIEIEMRYTTMCLACTQMIYLLDHQN